MSKKKRDLAPPHPGWIDKIKDATAGLAGKIVSSSLEQEEEDQAAQASNGVQPTSTSPGVISGTFGGLSQPMGTMNFSGSFGQIGNQSPLTSFAIEPPSGVSEKDIPVVDFRFTTIEKHPLHDGSEKVWAKMEDPKGSKRFIYKITKASLDKFKIAGKLKMTAFEQICLPHPGDPSLIIFGSDFRDGFVLDDETNLTAYWRIQCKKTGIFLEISNY